MKRFFKVWATYGLFDLISSFCLLWRVPRSKLNISRLSDCRFLHLAKFASSSGATLQWKVCINARLVLQQMRNLLMPPRIKSFFGAWTDCFTRQGSVQLKQVYANGNSYPRHGIDLTLQKNLKHFFKKYFVQVFFERSDFTNFEFSGPRF